MLDVANDGGVERFDDLHIDKIDEDWRPRERWIKAGIQAYRIALELRDEYGLPFVVSLVFSLEVSNQRRGVDFHTQAELEQRLDHTPPSLYLFERGKEPWVEMDRAIKEYSVASDAIIQKLDSTLIDSFGLIGTCFYFEFKSPAEPEYHRSVFVGG